MRRLMTTIASLLALGLLMAPSALASDGRGLYGATNDKVVTDAGFILIIFFPLFVLLMSRLQARLEKRKDARKAAEKALHETDPHGGW